MSDEQNAGTDAQSVASTGDTGTGFDSGGQSGGQAPTTVGPTQETRRIEYYDPQTGRPVYASDTPQKVQNVVGFDPQTGEPIYANEGAKVTGYDPQTGRPVYANSLGVEGAHEYFVNNYGTVYGDSEGDVVTKLSKIGVTAPIGDVRIQGVNTHKDGE